MYGSIMTSKNDKQPDLEAAQRNSSTEEERLFVVVSDDGNDDDDEDNYDHDEFVDANTVPVLVPVPFLTNTTCSLLRRFPAAITLIFVLFFLLLVTDVALRLGWLSSSGSRTTTNPNTSGSSMRWVATADILANTSGGIPNLMFLGDVGDYGLQGLALDPNNENILYEFHTLSARVLELRTIDIPNNTDDGADDDDDRRQRIIQVVGVSKRRIYNGTTDFPIIFNESVAHIGGIDWAYSQRNGPEIWIATHSEGTNGEGALWAVDPETLDVKGDARAVRVKYNLDWVAYNQDDGILYFGEFFNVKSVKRVWIDTLEPLPDLMLVLPDAYAESGLNYIQSAAFDLEGHLVLLGDDYHCTIYMLNVQTGAFVDAQGLLLGSETDGITFDHNRGSLLVGFNRQHSHEQVVGQEPMISVIQLDQK